MKRSSLLLMAVSALVALVAAVGAYGFEGSGHDMKGHPGGAPAGQSDYAVLSGKVVEVLNSGGYTYVLLQSGENKTWVAMPQTKVSVGQELAFPPGSVMPNFKSKTLNRTFDKVVFTNGPVALPGTKADKADKKSKPVAKPSAAPKENIKVDKAAGPNAYTVSEIFKDRAKLNGKEVVVRGKVVKVTEGVLGKNWFHIQDGTGSQSKADDDIPVTAKELPNVGDVVTVTGTMNKDKDFGYGYVYEVIVEDATFKK